MYITPIQAQAAFIQLINTGDTAQQFDLPAPFGPRIVIQNPSGAFLWDRYGAEEALQIQWAAKTIQPDLFGDIDIAAETKDFYKKFLNFDLNDDQVQKILLAQKT